MFKTKCRQVVVANAHTHSLNVAQIRPISLLSGPQTIHLHMHMAS
jgi:hypothetical protein